MPTPRAGWIGALLVIAAASLFGLLGVTSRFAYDAGVQPFAFVAWRAGVGALGIALVVMALRGPTAAWTNIAASGARARRGLLVAMVLAAGGVAALLQPLESPSIVALLVGVGLFAAALPSVMFLTGIRWIGGVRTGILMLFEPVVGVALAAILLAEDLQPLQVVGGATILVAAFLVQRGTRPTTEPGTVVLPAPGGP